MYDITILGAGVVGCAIARRLARYDLSILVIEAENDVAMGATKANSAIVHGGYAESHNKVKGRMCYQGRKQFAQLDSELHFGFDPIGSLVLAFDEADLPKLEALLENGRLNGLPDLSILNHEQILEMEPNVNPDVKYALYCEGAGVCSPYEMAIALMENAIHNGARLRLNERVEKVNYEKDHYVIKTDQQSYESRLVVNACGLHSGDFYPDGQVTGRSGEYLLFARGTGSVINHVLFQMPTKMGKGILVTPTYHGNLLVGPDAVNVDDKQTTVDRLLNIYAQALTTTTQIDPKKFIRSFAGIRAVSDTDDFVLEDHNGFIHCVGIQSPGLTSSPAIADWVCEQVAKHLTLTEKVDYNPNRRPIIERKQLLPASQIQDRLEIDGEDQIICRCEQVDKKTILDALSREIEVKTIDGIKRRTRAGMGFCQGSFCRKRVQKVMEEYWHEAIDPGFDIEHSGINRVEKKDFLLASKRT